MSLGNEQLGAHQVYTITVSWVDRSTMTYHITAFYSRILTILEVVQKNVQTLTLNAIVLNDNTSTPNDLARVSLLVDLAQTGPGTKHLRVTDFDQVDLVFCAESFDELDVFGFRASFNEDAKVSLTFVQCLGTFAKTTGEAIVYEGVLQDLLKCFLDGHFAAPWGVGSDLDGGLLFDFDFLSGVRHLFVILV